VIDVDVVYCTHLTGEEMDVWRSMQHGRQLTVLETHQLILLREISQHRAAADRLYRDLVALHSLTALPRCSVCNQFVTSCTCGG
jgi:hypothetical protein